MTDTLNCANASLACLHNSYCGKRNRSVYSEETETTATTTKTLKVKVGKKNKNSFRVLCHLCHFYHPSSSVFDRVLSYATVPGWALKGINVSSKNPFLLILTHNHKETSWKGNKKKVGKKKGQHTPREPLMISVVFFFFRLFLFFFYSLFFFLSCTETKLKKRKAIAQLRGNWLASAQLLVLICLAVGLVVFHLFFSLF